MTVVTMSGTNERVLAAIEHLISQNPRAAARFVSVVCDPPKIGSIKLSWRDGKLNGVEVIEQTY